MKTDISFAKIISVKNKPRMKVVFNKLTALLLFISFSIGATAQSVPDTARLNIGLEAGTPIYLTNMYTYSLGASLRLDFPITKSLYVTGTAGYNNLFASPNFSTTPGGILNVKAADMKTVPLKVGLKLFLIRHFYVLGEVGQTILVNKSEVYALKNNAFTYSPQIGMLFFLKKHNYIDAGIRYEGVGTFFNDTEKYSFWAAHIAYAFNL